MNKKMLPLMLAMMSMLSPSERTTINNRVIREHNPWDNINLSKDERRGKSYAEMQALRREKWEARA